MTDKELIGYAQIHSETDLALFSATHVTRLWTLAGWDVPEEVRRCPTGFWSVDRWDMATVLRTIRALHDEVARAVVPGCGPGVALGPTTEPSHGSRLGLR